MASINPVTRSNFQNHQPYASADSSIRIVALQINKLRLPAYQRKPDAKRVQEIVNAFDPHRDRPIEVSYRNGQYWIVDGQHRVRVHEIMNHTTIQCMVHYGLSYQQEASLFARQHDGEKHVSSKDRWNAFLEAEDEAPEVQAIIKECKKNGFLISNKGVKGSKNANVFGCVTELRKLYAKHGLDGLCTMLGVIKNAWSSMPNNTHREIVGAITKLMDTFPMDKKKWDKLSDKLHSKTPTPDRFLSYAASLSGRGQKRAAIAMASIYNKGISVQNNRLNEFLIK